MTSIDSESFPGMFLRQHLERSLLTRLVLPQRDFGSMSESTHLTRTFSDQGVKLRVRKDNRAISGLVECFWTALTEPMLIVRFYSQNWHQAIFQRVTHGNHISWPPSI